MQLPYEVPSFGVYLPVRSACQIWLICCFIGSCCSSSGGLLSGALCEPSYSFAHAPPQLKALGACRTVEDINLSSGIFGQTLR